MVLMGKIIIVPPKMVISIPVPNDGRAEFTGTTTPYPVNFSGGVMQSGSVLIKEPHNKTVIYDPMDSYGDYHSYLFRYADRESFRSSITIRTRERHQISRSFWSLKELEELLTQLVGDVLVQIDGGTGAWSFAATNSLDNASLEEILNRQKSHHIRVNKGLRNEIIDWLENNVTEYDFFDGYYYESEDTVCVRSDKEAVHFKMKWVGAEPELDEEEEIPF